MRRNWILTMLVVSLIFATSSWAQDLYQMAHDRFMILQTISMNGAS